MNAARKQGSVSSILDSSPLMRFLRLVIWVSGPKWQIFSPSRFHFKLFYCSSSYI